DEVGHVLVDVVEVLVDRPAHDALNVVELALRLVGLALRVVAIVGVLHVTDGLAGLLALSLGPDRTEAPAEEDDRHGGRADDGQWLPADDSCRHHATASWILRTWKASTSWVPPRISAPTPTHKSSSTADRAGAPDAQKPK